MPNINLVYRKNTTPTANANTINKGSPLTNDELDNNFFGINAEVLLKAPINNAVFTGSTTIPNIVASGGTVNGTVIGGTSPAAATFTDVVTTGSLTVGDATGDILSVRAGTAALPALTTAGDLNTGVWFPAADTIAISTNGVERIRAANTGITIANDTALSGDLAVNGGDLTTSATTFNLVDTTATTVNFARAGTAVVIGATSGTTTVRNAFTSTGAATLSSTLGVTGATTLSSTLAVTGAATLSSTLAVTGATTLNNNVTIAGSTVAASEYFRITDGAGSPVTRFLVDSANGNTTISGTLGVSGATTLSSTLGVTGATTLSSTLGVSGATTLSSTLAVTGATTLSSTLGVTGNVAVNTNKFNIIAASGNTTIAGTLGVTGATSLTSATASGTLGVTGITTLGELNAQATSVSSLTSSSGVQGTILTSTVAIGTAPLTVTSTTKVANLNADRVDNITFSAPAESGCLPYVTAVSGTDYSVGFTPNPGVAGTLLTSSGGSSPTWTPASGLSAGGSYSTRHILDGVTGDTIYQKSLAASATTVSGSKTVTLASTTGILPGVLVLGNANIPVGTLVDAVVNSTQITITEFATGSAIASTTFLQTAKLPIGTTGQVLNVSGGIPAWTSNISVSGSLTHGGLSPSAGTAIDQVYTVTDALTLNTTDWFNTSVNSTELVTGSYMVQVNTGTEFYTGIMSWYSPDINSALTDEVILHRASAGTESSNLFLRVERTDTTSPDMTLQISSSAARTAANYTFKFRRML